MENQRLYIIQGTGNDSVGLVGRITTPIANAKGNIVDLRQDVLHGLFTIFMVVELTENALRIEELRTLVKQIAEDTGLEMTVEKYTPIARKPDKNDLLMILIGKDQPGIVATSCQMLGRYNANIEFAQTIGREGVFLMELLTDISQCSIPLVNLMQTVRQQMAAMDINTIFQTTDVFNKRKRAILFNFSQSLMSHAVCNEILQQTGIPGSSLEIYPRQDPAQSLRNAAAKLDGFPLDVIDKLFTEITATRGSAELIQTLKIMGYKIGLVSNCFGYFTEPLRKKLDLDYCFGVPTEIDDDARTMVGEMSNLAVLPLDINAIVKQIATREAVDKEDITIINDNGGSDTLGIRIDFGLEMLLDCFNKRIISREALIGLLGCWGIPRV